MGAAAAPILIGSALGAVTNPKNPLQGALLGGVMGGVGGSFMGGAMNAGNAAATTAMTGANPAVMGTAGMGVAPMTAGATYNAAAPGMVANFGNATMPTYAATGGTTGLIGSSTAPLTMAERFSGGVNALKSDIGALNTFANQNPVATQVGLSTARDIMAPKPPPPVQPPGLIRGNPIQQQQESELAMAMPQINLLG
jgi:hypothetical protein